MSGEMTKEFVNKKSKSVAYNELTSVSQRAQLFDSIHGMRQLQNRLRAG